MKTKREDFKSADTKNLVRKEMKLCVPPAIFLFSLLAFLILVPQYPYVIGIFYFCFQIQIIFSLLAANKDIEFTASMPVSRKDIVKSKFIIIVIIQAVYIFTAIVAALISSLLINKTGNPVGMDANFAFFGLVFIYMAVFNYLFLTGYFKTGYKWGIPFLKGLFAMLITAVICEGIILIPAVNRVIDSLDPATFIYQFIVLIFGAAVYVLSLFGGYKKSVKNFIKVNL